jgi:5'-3' exonuclease
MYRIKMIALIDGDLVCYRSAASANNDEEWVAQTRASKTIQDIMEETFADSHLIFLTRSDTNFRKTIDPLYKANRKDIERPQHLAAVQQFLVTNYGASWCEGYEADDALGVSQTTLGDSIICSLDKDLLQIPGKHYNWVNKEFKTVTEEEGLRSFFAQSLIGDTSDNIFGIKGLGKVKTERILRDLTPSECYSTCRDLYADDDRYHRNLSLLWIWRKMYDNCPYVPTEIIYDCPSDVRPYEKDVPPRCNSECDGSREDDKERGCGSEDCARRITEDTKEYQHIFEHSEF